MEKNTRISSRRKHCIRTAVQAIGIIVLLNATVTFSMIQFMSPRIVSFDMKGTINQFMEQAAERELSEEQSKVLSERFTSSLQDSLENYQRLNNAVIFVKQAVVGGASDITGEIQLDVSNRMQENN